MSVEITDFTDAFKYGAVIAPPIVAGISGVMMAYYSGQSDHKNRNNQYKTFSLSLFGSAALVVYGLLIWLGLGVYTDGTTELPFWFWLVTAVSVGPYVLNMLRHSGKYEWKRAGGSRHPMDGSSYDIPEHAWSSAICFTLSFVMAALSQYDSTTTGLGLALGLAGLAFQGFAVSGFITAYRRYGIIQDRVKETNEDAAKLYGYKLLSLGFFILVWLSLDLCFILGPNVAGVLANQPISIWLLVMCLIIMTLFLIDYWVYDVKPNPSTGMPSFDPSGAANVAALLAALSTMNTAGAKGIPFNFDIPQQAAPQAATKAAASNPFGKMSSKNSKQH